MALKPLSGKIALVTGAGQNIGRGIALSLSASGATIVVNGRDNEGLVSETVAEIKKKWRKCGGVYGRYIRPHFGQNSDR